MEQTTEFDEMPTKEDFKLDENAVKGDRGVLLIIGGSEMYTGAPFFASKAAFLTGIDLVYILTCTDHRESSPTESSLKSLLPECIILPIKRFDLRRKKFILDRTTTVLLGSGMGRPNKSSVENKIYDVFYYFLKKKTSPMIIDGDGIRFLYKRVDVYMKNQIFTPNTNEMKYIKRDKILSKGGIILAKGPEDHILADKNETIVARRGGSRRCGGLGDILAGILSSFLNVYEEKETAVKKASVFMKEMSKRAFLRHGLAMMPKDVLNEIKFFFSHDSASI